MFAVIYRGYIQPDLEEEYQKHWKTVATYFVAQRGALGSTLHKSEEGLWIAYSRWPDKATRDASWPSDQEPVNEKFPDEVQNAIAWIQHAFNDPKQRLPELCMEIKEEIICPPSPF